MIIRVRKVRNRRGDLKYFKVKFQLIKPGGTSAMTNDSQIEIATISAQSRL